MIKHKKNQIVLSNTDFLYLDIGFGTPLGDKYGDFITWKDIYLKFNPNPDVQGEVIGGEVCLWSELDNGLNHFNKLYPRTSVAAQKYYK